MSVSQAAMEQCVALEVALLQPEVPAHRDTLAAIIADEHAATEEASNAWDCLAAVAELVQLVVQGEYLAALQSTTAAYVLNTKDATTSTATGEDERPACVRALAMHSSGLLAAEGEEAQQRCRAVAVLAVAVALLRAFMQENWSGPPLGEKAAFLAEQCGGEHDARALERYVGHASRA